MPEIAQAIDGLAGAVAAVAVALLWHAVIGLLKR